MPRVEAKHVSYCRRWCVFPSVVVLGVVVLGLVVAGIVHAIEGGREVLFKLAETETMSRPILSTHVLDTSTGTPAVGLFVELYKKRDDTWTQWHNTMTSGDGRIQFPFSKESMAPGTYKLKFNVEDYYKKTDKTTLYPYIEIVFNTTEGGHYHIPLLLSPYGYTTYRGS